MVFLKSMTGYDNLVPMDAELSSLEKHKKEDLFSDKKACHFRPPLTMNHMIVCPEIYTLET